MENNIDTYYDQLLYEICSVFDCDHSDAEAIAEARADHLDAARQADLTPYQAAKFIFKYRFNPAN
jgi:hypothetical protein